MEIQFGTAGIRGIIGDGPNMINEANIQKVTTGFAKTLLKKHINQKITIVIGYDNRFKSFDFAKLSFNILKSFGIKPIMFKDTSPTPLVSFAIRELQASGGIMITASHNPKEYNGYKVYDKEGCQIMPGYAKAILNNCLTWKNAKNNPNKFNYKLKYISKKLEKKYLNRIIKSLNINNKLDNITVAYSPLHGTGYTYGKKILKKLGVNIIETKTQNYKSDFFENAKSCNPEDKESYEEVIKYGLKSNSDLILVTDPDADRVGLGIKSGSKYVLMNGNETAAIILKYLIDTISNKKEYFVVGSFVSSGLLKTLALKNGLKYYQTATGFKWIGKYVDDKSKNGDKFLFGFEESYGTLIGNQLGRDKDAIQAIAFICLIASFYKKQNKSILDVYNEIQKHNLFFKTKQISMPSTSKISITKIKEQCKKICDLKVIEDYTNNPKIELKNKMLKVIFNDDSWFAIRPSGTEPKIKIYINVVAKRKKELEARSVEIIKIIEKLKV